MPLTWPCACLALRALLNWQQLQARLLCPCPSFPPTFMRLPRTAPHRVHAVFNEILDQSSSVSWDDIAGQEHAKALVQEMVVWPLLNPQLFTVSRAPTSIPAHYM